MAQKRIGPWNWWALLNCTHSIYKIFFDEAIFSCCFNSQNDNDGLWVKFVAQHHPMLECWWTEFVSWVLEEMLLQEEPDSSSNRHLTSQTENLCCFVFQLGASSVCLLIANGVLYVKIYPNHRISRKILLQAWKWRSKWILNAINYQNSLHHINTLLCGTSHEIFWWIHIVWNLRIFTDNWYIRM